MRDGVPGEVAFPWSAVLLQLRYWHLGFQNPGGAGRRSLGICNLLKRLQGMDMAKAVWNGHTLAESETYETVEGNIYFPEETVKREYLRPSSTTSSCPWKGQARYYTLLVDGRRTRMRRGTTRIRSLQRGM